MEIYRRIKNHDDYEVSNYGNVKSYKRGKEMILKQIKRSKLANYLSVKLDGRMVSTHRLVAEAFLGVDLSENKVVHHIDNDPMNNHVSNLAFITQRENSYTHSKSTSKYKGVYWSADRKKWRVGISINGKWTNLGQYDTEIEASETYNEKLKQIN